jgi:hypothetical protein
MVAPVVQPQARALIALVVAAAVLVLGLVGIVIRPQENRDALTLSARPFQATSQNWLALATIDKTDAYCVWYINRKEDAVSNALSKCGQGYKLASVSDRECVGIARWGRELYWSSDVSPRQAALAAIRKCELAVREACGLHFAICPDGTGHFHSEDWPNHP